MSMSAEERINKIREYHSKWQRENPDRVRRYRERYILKKAAELEEEMKKQLISSCEQSLQSREDTNDTDTN